MNEINAARRLRVAAAETAEAHKVWIACNQRVDLRGKGSFSIRIQDNGVA